MYRKLFACLLSWTLISGLSQLGWHGLVPLHSTKDDVTRLLGSSNDSNELRAKYNFPSEDVYIVFSNKDICGNEPRSVPAGTLLMIEVTPITKAKLATLHLDPRSYRKFDPSSPQGIGYEAYINDQEGVIIRAYKGEVDKLIYFASAKDKDLCSKYYARPEEFVRIVADYMVRKFDEYSGLSSRDEKARLDNFASYLKNDEPQLKGYIIVYAGPNARPGEARVRAKRTKDYLRVRGIEATRIVTIEGGRRDRSEVELYVLPSSVPPPAPNPPRNE